MSICARVRPGEIFRGTDTDAYRSNDKDGLQKGVNLISEGNGLLDKANQLSGNGYDTKKYNDALYLARKKLMELR